MTELSWSCTGTAERVGLVEWHPTTNNILFSAGYDYKVGSPWAQWPEPAQQGGRGREKGIFRGL